jgi:hypothetical protein
MLMDEEACLENVLIVDEKSFFQYFCDYDIWYNNCELRGAIKLHCDKWPTKTSGYTTQP